MRSAFLWGAALLLAACGRGQEKPPDESRTALGPGEVARVGGLSITADVVGKIAAAQRISPAEARSRAIFDALMAAGAVQRGLDRDPFVIAERRGVLADALLMRVKQEASREPSTPEEIERVTATHWLDLDRPEARRVVHAVAVASESDAEARKKAQEVAQRIAAAVKGIEGANDFLEAARKVDAAGLELRAEPLAPVTQDGRVADLVNRPEPGQPPTRYDMAFVNAVWRLQKPGEQLGPLPTPFGWHVMMLIEVQPARVVPEAERTRMLRDEIVAGRAKEKFDKLVQEIRAKVPVSVERNAEGHMATIAAPSGER